MGDIHYVMVSNRPNAKVHGCFQGQHYLLSTRDPFERWSKGTVILQSHFRLRCGWTKLSYPSHKGATLPSTVWFVPCPPNRLSFESLIQVNATIVVILGGCTSKVRPIDVSLTTSPLKTLCEACGKTWRCSMSIMDVQRSQHGLLGTHLAQCPEQLCDEMLQGVQPKQCSGWNQNNLIRCAKELPEFNIPFGVSAQESGQGHLRRYW